MFLLQTVICDLDGTLVDSEAIAFEVYRQLWQEIAPGSLPEDAYSLLAGKTQEERVHLICSRTGCPLSSRELVARASERFDARWKEYGMPTLPGVDRFLGMVRASGLRLGLATSSHRAYVDQILNEKGWGDVFEIKVVREDAVHLKPAPDLYQEALRRLRLPSASAVAIEDSIPGVLSARGAGISVLGVRHARFQGELPATKVVTSLEAVSIDELQSLLIMTS